MQFRQGITDIALVVDQSGVVELLDNHTPGAFVVAMEQPEAVHIRGLPERFSPLPGSAMLAMRSAIDASAMRSAKDVVLIVVLIVLE